MIMIGVTFRFGGDVIKALVAGDTIAFEDPQGKQAHHLSQLNISKAGAIKEFPDLKNDSDWKNKAIDRFYNKFKTFPNEDAKMDYVVKELAKFGYTPLIKQKPGFRPTKV